MESYTVGSISNLICQEKGIKIKSKKQEKLIVKEVKPSSISEISEQNLDKPTKEKKNSKRLRVKDLLKDSKIKKVNKTNNSNIKRISEHKSDVINFEPQPSDSENEESDETSLKKNDKSSKKFQLKDFTENTVFVGNIPLNYDKQKICKLFSKFGKIKSARIRCVPVADINMSKKVAAVKKKFNPNRNSLVAYVKFESKDSANAAIQANGMVLDGHHIRVDFAEEVKERDNNKAVFVGGLPFNIEDDELWNFFEKCGKINNVRVIRDSQTSMGKGFGYVNFDSTAAVELALQLDGQTLKKRAINVKRCVKARNKNKLNAFGKTKSKELTNQLLTKKSKKFKTEKKKMKIKDKSGTVDFRGKEASCKEKKKKKLSKAQLQKRKVIKILGAS